MVRRVVGIVMLSVVVVTVGAVALVSCGGAGELRWRYETGHNVFSSPAVVDGVVYVGSGDDYLYALDAASGQLRWRYQTGGSSVYSSPAVVDGVVYVGSEDGSVYALSTGR